MSAPMDLPSVFSKREEKEDIKDKGPLRHARYDIDVAQKAAPFEHLVEINLKLRNEYLPKPLYDTYLSYYPKVLEAFENEHGAIISQYISKHASVVFTEKGNLIHIEETPEIASLALIHRSDKIRIEADRLLEESDKMNLFKMIFEILSHLYYSINSQIEYKSRPVCEHEPVAEHESRHKELIEYLKIELDEISHYFIRCAQRRALSHYYQSMLKGLGIVSIFAVGISIVLNYYQTPLLLTAAFFGSILSGGFGALISLMQRISSGTFKPDYEAGVSHIRRIGIFRPIIGAVMGLIIFFLLMSELTPLTLPTDTTIRTFYIVIMAFTGGFTERWAEGMLPSITKDEKIKSIEENE